MAMPLPIDGSIIGIEDVGILGSTLRGVAHAVKPRAHRAARFLMSTRFSHVNARGVAHAV